MEDSIEKLSNRFCSEIKALFQENLEVFGNFSNIKMKASNELIFDIPDPGDRDCRNINHRSRSEKIGNKICNKWYNLKGKIDIVLG